MSDAPLRFTPADAAVAIGCSQTWIRRLVERGDLPGERLSNGQITIAAADVERLRTERAARPRRTGIPYTPAERFAHRVAAKAERAIVRGTGPRR